MKIDRRRFIEIKSDKKVDRQIITINENGVIEISREMQDVLKKNVGFRCISAKTADSSF